MPVTTPDDEPTDAMNGLPLVHTPPKLRSLKVIDAPWQTLDGPVMPGGSGLTDNALVMIQPPML